MAKTKQTHSRLEQTIAVTLVASMLISTPGSTSWAADNSSKKSKPAVQVTGNNPQQYRSPLPKNSKASETIQLIGASAQAIQQLANLEAGINANRGNPVALQRFIAAEGAVGNRDLRAQVQGPVLTPSGLISAQNTPISQQYLDSLLNSVGSPAIENVSNALPLAHQGEAAYKVNGSLSVLDQLKLTAYGYKCDEEGKCSSEILSAKSSRENLSRGKSSPSSSALSSEVYLWVSVIENAYVSQRTAILDLTDALAIARPQLADFQRKLVETKRALALAEAQWKQYSATAGFGAQQQASLLANRIQSLKAELAKPRQIRNPEGGPAITIQGLEKSVEFLSSKISGAKPQGATVPNFRAEKSDVEKGYVQLLKEANEKFEVASGQVSRLAGANLGIKELRSKLDLEDEVRKARNRAFERNAKLITFRARPVSANGDSQNAAIYKAGLKTNETALADENLKSSKEYQELFSSDIKFQGKQRATNAAVEKQTYADFKSGKILARITAVRAAVSAIQKVIEKNSDLYNELAAVRDGKRSKDDLTAIARKYLGLYDGNMRNAILAVGAADYNSVSGVVAGSNDGFSSFLRTWYGSGKNNPGLFSAQQAANKAFDDFERYQLYTPSLNRSDPALEAYMRATGRTYLTNQGKSYLVASGLASTDSNQHFGSLVGLSDKNWRTFRTAQTNGDVFSYGTYAGSIGAQNTTWNRVSQKFILDVQEHPGVAVAEVGGVAAGAGFVVFTGGSGSGVVAPLLLGSGSAAVAYGVGRETWNYGWQGFKDASWGAATGFVTGASFAGSAASVLRAARILDGVAVAGAGAGSAELGGITFARRAINASPRLAQAAEWVGGVSSSISESRLATTLGTWGSKVGSVASSWTPSVVRTAASGLLQYTGLGISVAVPPSIGVWGVGEGLNLLSGQHANLKSWSDGLFDAATGAGRLVTLAPLAFATGDSGLWKSLVNYSTTQSLMTAAPDAMNVIGLNPSVFNWKDANGKQLLDENGHPIQYSWSTYKDGFNYVDPNPQPNEKPALLTMKGQAGVVARVLGTVGDMGAFGVIGGMTAKGVGGLVGKVTENAIAKAAAVTVATNVPMFVPTMDFMRDMGEDFSKKHFADGFQKIGEFAVGAVIAKHAGRYSTFAEPGAAQKSSSTNFFGDVVKETAQIGAVGAAVALAGGPQSLLANAIVATKVGFSPINELGRSLSYSKAQEVNGVLNRFGARNLLDARQNLERNSQASSRISEYLIDVEVLTAAADRLAKAGDIESLDYLQRIATGRNASASEIPVPIVERVANGTAEREAVAVSAIAPVQTGTEFSPEFRQIATRALFKANTSKIGLDSLLELRSGASDAAVAVSEAGSEAIVRVSRQGVDGSLVAPLELSPRFLDKGSVDSVIADRVTKAHGVASIPELLKASGEGKPLVVEGVKIEIDPALARAFAREIVSSAEISRKVVDGLMTGAAPGVREAVAESVLELRSAGSRLASDTLVRNARDTLDSETSAAAGKILANEAAVRAKANGEDVISLPSVIDRLNTQRVLLEDRAAKARANGNEALAKQYDLLSAKAEAERARTELRLSTNESSIDLVRAAQTEKSVAAAERGLLEAQLAAGEPVSKSQLSIAALREARADALLAGARASELEVPSTTSDSSGRDTIDPAARAEKAELYRREKGLHEAVADALSKSILAERARDTNASHLNELERAAQKAADTVIAARNKLDDLKSQIQSREDRARLVSNAERNLRSAKSAFESAQADLSTVRESSTDTGNDASQPSTRNVEEKKAKLALADANQRAAKAELDLLSLEPSGGRVATNELVQAKRDAKAAKLQLEALEKDQAAESATAALGDFEKRSRDILERFDNQAPLSVDAITEITDQLIRLDPANSRDIAALQGKPMTKEVVAELLNKTRQSLETASKLAKNQAYDAKLELKAQAMANAKKSPIDRVKLAVAELGSLGQRLTGKSERTGTVDTSRPLSFREALQLAASRKSRVDALAPAPTRDFAKLAAEADAKAEAVGNAIRAALPDSGKTTKESFDKRWKPGLDENGNVVTGQFHAVRAALLGESLGIQMSVGGGKTVVALGIIGGRLLGSEARGNVDLVVPNPHELNKYLNELFGDSGKTYHELLRDMGGNVYDMAEISDGVRKNDSAMLQEFLRAMADPKAVRIWTTESLGHLQTNSHDVKTDVAVRDALVKASKDADRLVLADEGDILLADPIQYVLSNESKSVGIEGLKYNAIYDKVSKAIGFDSKSQTFKADKEGIVRVEQADHFERLSAEGEKVYFIDPANDHVYLSESARAHFEDLGVRQGSIHGEAERVLKGIEMRQQYGHDVDEQTGRRVIAPIGAGGTVETNMVLNDALLATSIARARGSSVAEALNEVRVSKTSMSSSGGRLFVGDSQVVLMSGSLEAVESAAQAYGIKVQPFGEVKNVFRESSAQPDMSSRGVLAPGSVVVSADREALATKIVNEMLVGSKFGMRQLFISKDEALRSLVYEKLKKANVSPAYFDHNPIDSKNAKNLISETGPQFIVGSMNRAGRGVDYKGNIDLIVDATGLRASELTQALGRVERFAGQKFSRTLVALEGSVRASADAAFQPKVYEALKSAGKVRHEVAVESAKSIAGTLPETPAGLRLLEDRAGASQSLSIEEAIQVGSWKLEMDASSRGMESNITNLIKDRFLEMPIMDELRKYASKPQSKEFLALQATIQKMLNNEFYVSQAMSSTRESMNGVDRMRRALDTARQQALLTLSDFESRAQGTSLGGFVRGLKDQWKGASTDGEGSTEAVSRANSVQEAIHRALSRGKELAPTSGGQRFTSAGTYASRLIRDAKASAEAGTLSKAQAVRIRDAAARVIHQEGPLPRDPQISLLAGAATPEMVQRILTAGSHVQPLSPKGGSFAGFAARLQSARNQFADDWQSSQGVNPMRRIVSSAIHSFEVAFGKGGLTDAKRVELAIRGFAEAGNEQLRSVAESNIALWTLARPQVVASLSSAQTLDRVISSAQNLTAGQRTSLRARLEMVSGIAATTAPIGKDVSVQYSTRWSGKPGEGTVVLEISKPGAEAALKAVSLAKLAELSGVPVTIQLPIDASESFRSGIKTIESNSQGRVSVAQAPSALVNPVARAFNSVRHPISTFRASRQGSASDLSPIAVFERAISAVDLAKQGKTGLLGSSKVDQDIAAVRTVARQIQQAIDLGLMHDDRIDDKVKFLLAELAKPENSVADARAAIEAYLDQSVADHVASAKVGPLELPGHATPVTLSPELSLVASMQSALKSALKGQPSAGIASLSPLEAERAGDRIRANDSSRQNAYVGLTSDLARYHQNILDLLGTQKVSRSKARTASQIASRPLSTENLVALANQAYAQAPMAFRQSVQDLIAQQSVSKGSQALYVASDDMDHASFSALQSAFGERNVIRQLDLEKFMAARQSAEQEGRAKAVAAFVPSTDSAVEKVGFAAASKASLKSLLSGFGSSKTSAPSDDTGLFGLPSYATAVMAAVTAAVALPFLTSHGYVPDVLAALSGPKGEHGTVSQAAMGPVGLIVLMTTNWWRKASDRSVQVTARARALGVMLRNA